MSQRDRLAGMLHAIECDCSDEIAPEAAAYKVADALLARGVRVVDVETLTEAITVNLKAVHLAGMTVDEPVTIDGVEYWRKSPIGNRLAQAVLATLDGEADR